MSAAADPAVDVAVIGGGFAGAMACIRLAERNSGPFAICLFEPREIIGGGIAYSTTDPDHRLNGPNELVDFWGQDHFAAWYAQNCADGEDVSGGAPVRPASCDRTLRRSQIRNSCRTERPSDGPPAPRGPGRDPCSRGLRRP